MHMRHTIHHLFGPLRLLRRLWQSTEKVVAGQDNGLLPVERKYQHVTLTTRLLNSYLSVFYRHQSSEESHNMFCKLYDELGVERSARTYVEALERCGHAGR